MPIDPYGVYHYDEADLVSPRASDFFNKVPDSVTEIVRTRLTYSATDLTLADGIAYFNFPAGLFSAPPKVVASVSNDTYMAICVVHAVSAVSTAIRVRYLSGSSWLASAGFSVSIIASA